MEEVADRFGRIDVLVNNAGISGVGDLAETTPERGDEVMRVNVRSVFLMSRAVVPGMLERRFGVVVNVASAIAETGLARRVSYAASKGAVLVLTRSMQVDCAPFGVRVNAVLPGTIHTSVVERYLDESYADREEGLRAIRARHLTGELGRPGDVANAILFLASDESRFVLGSGLTVDGGLTGTCCAAASLRRERWFVGVAVPHELPGDDLAHATVNDRQQIRPAVLGHSHARHVELPGLPRPLDPEEAGRLAPLEWPPALDQLPFPPGVPVAQHSAKRARPV